MYEFDNLSLPRKTAVQPAKFVKNDTCNSAVFMRCFIRFSVWGS